MSTDQPSRGRDPREGVRTARERRGGGGRGGGEEGKRTRTAAVAASSRLRDGGAWGGGTRSCTASAPQNALTSLWAVSRASVPASAEVVIRATPPSRDNGLSAEKDQLPFPGQMPLKM